MTVSSQSECNFSRGDVSGEKRRRSPVKWGIVAVIFCAAMVWAVWFIAGSEPDALKVEPIGEAIGSGASNQFTFRLTNRHKRSIRFSYLPEAKTANGWPIESSLRVNGSTSPFPPLNAELKAGQSTVVSVTKPAGGPWRLDVCYSKETFKRDEIIFKISQRLSIWGWDWIAERIRSEKFLVHVICSPELGE
jgi:hypothetical protein